MKRYRARRARRHEVAELNVTAFMNLMVVLVPFLLILAVFSRVTIHELNLPGESAEIDEQPNLQLEVVVRSQQLILADRARGPIQVIDNRDGEYDIAALGDWLERIKQEAPASDSATILLEPQVDYQSLIRVMDTVRGRQHVEAGERVWVELFPHVSIGEAPPAEGGPSA